jgi:hypothetical protein
MGDFEWLTRRTKSPSSEMVRLDETGSEIGFSLFATHTIVCSGILLYQMPMYHLPFDPSATDAVTDQIINQLCYRKKLNSLHSNSEIITVEGFVVYSSTCNIGLEREILYYV